MFSKTHIITRCNNCKLHRSCHDNLKTYEKICSQRDTKHTAKVGLSFTAPWLPSTDPRFTFTLHQFSLLKVFLSTTLKLQAIFQNWPRLFPSTPFPIRYSLVFPSPAYFIFCNTDRVIKWKINTNTVATKYIKSVWYLPFCKMFMWYVTTV